MFSFQSYHDRMENQSDSEPDDNTGEINTVDQTNRSLGDVPPPEYQLHNAADDFGGDVMNASESPELKTLHWDDMARHGAEDVEAEMWRLKSLGYNPTKLGDQMSDEEFAKYTGMPWQADQS